MDGWQAGYLGSQSHEELKQDIKTCTSQLILATRRIRAVLTVRINRTPIRSISVAVKGSIGRLRVALEETSSSLLPSKVRLRHCCCHLHFPGIPTGVIIWVSSSTWPMRAHCGGQNNADMPTTLLRYMLASHSGTGSFIFNLHIVVDALSLDCQL